MGSEVFTILVERLKNAKRRIEIEAFQARKSPEQYVQLFGHYQGLIEAEAILEEIQSADDAEKS